MFVRTQIVLWSVVGALVLVVATWPDIDLLHAQRTAYAGSALAALSLALFFAWPTPPAAPVEVGPPALLQEKAICPHCLMPNRLTRVRCRRCIAPIGWQATMDPFSAHVMEGWSFAALARSTAPNRVLLSVAWLWFPPYVLGSLALWGAWVTGALPLWEPVYPAVVVLMVLYGGTSAFGLWNVTRNYFRTRRKHEQDEEAPP